MYDTVTFLGQICQSEVKVQRTRRTLVRITTGINEKIKCEVILDLKYPGSHVQFLSLKPLLSTI